jgi:hypothetical protein
VFLPILHLALHILVPGIVAYLGFKKEWFRAWLIMCLTMLVDLDHLMAAPVYDPNRCGIGFHPLHTSPAIGAYFLMLLVPKIRIIGIGLLLHMGLDYIDCIW